MAFCARSDMRRPSIEYPARPFRSIFAAMGDLSQWTGVGWYQDDITDRAGRLVYP